MRDFTFLDKVQIFGPNEIKPIKKRGINATLTDFSILLGASVKNKRRVGTYWTKSSIRGWRCDTWFRG